MNPKYLAIGMITLNTIVGIGYLLLGKDVPRFLYWIASALITLSTLFMR